MEVKDLETRIEKCSFILKCLLKRWDALDKPATETSTYKMVTEALEMLEGRFHEMTDLELVITEDEEPKGKMNDETIYLNKAILHHMAISALEQDITISQVLEQALRAAAESDIFKHAIKDQEENENIDDQDQDLS